MSETAKTINKELRELQDNNDILTGELELYKSAFRLAKAALYKVADIYERYAMLGDSPADAATEMYKCAQAELCK